MSAKIIDGKFVAQRILENVKRETGVLHKKGIKPTLAIILTGRNPSSLSYIRQKEKACEAAGIICRKFVFPEKVSTKILINKIESLNRDKKCHGILVQMPLPRHIEAPKVIKALNPYKDVDGFHAYAEFEDLVPCTPAGVIRLLDFYRIPIEGKEVVMVGRSNIVGKPLAMMLLNRGATVIVCHSKTKNLAKHTKQADILCVAVGKPGLIKANMVKKGCIVIDVGFTRINEKIFGDVAFDSVKKKAKWITPVPGGVGPMTVACLMDNVLRAIKKQLTL